MARKSVDIVVSGATYEALCKTYVSFYHAMEMMRAEGVELLDVVNKSKKFTELCIKDFIKEDKI